MTLLKPPGDPGIKQAQRFFSKGSNRAPSAFLGGRHGKIRSDTTAPSSTGIVVFGLDATGKAKAGRFSAKDAPAARKAAVALKLAVCSASRPNLAEILSKVPVGRLHSPGKAFIPYIARTLYDAILAACAEPAASKAAVAKAGPNVTMEPPAKPPKDHASIAVGDLVLCTEGPKEGYWESIVTERDGDNLVCRFRDYPRLPAFKCTVQAVALMYVTKE